MTEFDKQLVAKADKMRPRDYFYIDGLIEIADTPEARERLECIKHCNYGMVKDSI